MEESSKQLLLKDLCAMLPYGVKVNNEIQGDFVIYGICENYIFARTTTSHADFRIENIKPYLFPLSSMTDEQEEEYKKLNGYEIGCFPHTEEALDYLIKYNFDLRGLIERKLAIDATGLNIY